MMHQVRLGAIRWGSGYFESHQNTALCGAFTSPPNACSPFYYARWTSWPRKYATRSRNKQAKKREKKQAKWARKRENKEPTCPTLQALPGWGSRIASNSSNQCIDWSRCLHTTHSICTHCYWSYCVQLLLWTASKSCCGEFVLHWFVLAVPGACLQLNGGRVKFDILENNWFTCFQGTDRPSPVHLSASTLPPNEFRIHYIHTCTAQSLI